MKIRTLLVVALFCVAATTVSAATYTVAVRGCEGDYAVASRDIEIDFGRSFSSIQSLSITWSGQVTAGWFITHDINFGDIAGPWTGGFCASITPGRLYGKYAETVSLGGSTYPDAESFGVSSTFKGSGSWDELLDGRSTLKVWLNRPTIFLGQLDPASTPPTGFLNGATLTLEATPVPEPSSLVALTCGLGGIAGLLKPRRRLCR